MLWGFHLGISRFPYYDEMTSAGLHNGTFLLIGISDFTILEMKEFPIFRIHETRTLTSSDLPTRIQNGWTV
jgi:hypothetical protein